MPRRRKRPEVPTGLPYGTGKDLRVVAQSGPDPAPTGGSTGGGAPPPQHSARGAGFPPEVLEAARRGPTPGPGLFDAPTDSPNEPVTAGIRSGPGPGPEVLARRRRTTLEDFYAQLHAASGQPFYRQLARRVVRR